MSILGLKKANCKNCYKCIKVCPVKSIRLADEQAQIIESDCILCGSCLNACPQNAKTLHSDLDQVKGWIRDERKVIASVAPSFYAAFSLDTEGRFAALLQRLGFWGAAQTADGAAYVTAQYHKLAEAGKMENILTTCCPVVNDLIEKYYPDLIPLLAPVVSPMIAHGRLLKETYGRDCKVVFIGPCIAKKAESGDIRHDGQVDAVLHYGDLEDWMTEAGVELAACGEADFLRNDSEILRLYPMAGGILKTLKQYGDVLHYDLASIEGIDACKELLEAIRAGEIKRCLIELNACAGGCLGGPARGEQADNRFAGRLRLRKHVEQTGSGYPALRDGVDLRKAFLDRSAKREVPTEETIRSILKKIGKDTPEQELNCGSCGYVSCRDKAIAVYQGKAELTMCMPFMKERAESLSNYVLTETPNITVIVDSDLNIIEFNRAAEELFGISRHTALTKGLYELIDTADFLQVLDTRRSIIDRKVTYEAYQKTLLQSMIYLEENNCVMGLFKDITQEEKRMAERYQLRVDTVDMAQKIIDKQMMVAQEIASLLGETTAETKVTLTKLKNMMVRDGDDV